MQKQFLFLTALLLCLTPLRSAELAPDTFSVPLTPLIHESDYTDVKTNERIKEGEEFTETKLTVTKTPLAAQTQVKKNKIWNEKITPKHFIKRNIPIEDYKNMYAAYIKQEAPAPHIVEYTKSITRSCSGMTYDQKMTVVRNEKWCYDSTEVKVREALSKETFCGFFKGKKDCFTALQWAIVFNDKERTEFLLDINTKSDEVNKDIVALSQKRPEVKGTQAYEFALKHWEGLRGFGRCVGKFCGDLSSKIESFGIKTISAD